MRESQFPHAIFGKILKRVFDEFIELAAYGVFLDPRVELSIESVQPYTKSRQPFDVSCSIAFLMCSKSLT